MADTYHHSNILAAARGDIPLKMRGSFFLRRQGKVRSPSMKLASVAALRAHSPCWPLIRRKIRYHGGPQEKVSTTQVRPSTTYCKSRLGFYNNNSLQQNLCRRYLCFLVPLVKRVPVATSARQGSNAAL